MPTIRCMFLSGQNSFDFGELVLGELVWELLGTLYG